MSCLATTGTIQFGPISYGGSIDVGLDCTSGLEWGENLSASCTVTPADPAELNIAAVQVLTEDTRLTNQILPANKSLGWNITSLGTTAGDYKISIKIVGDSNTIQTYEGTVTVQEFA